MSKYFSVQNEHCSFEGSQASNICPSNNSIIKVNMSKEHWQNNTDGGNMKYPEKNLFHCHSFIKNFTRIGPGSNPGLCCERLVLNCLNHSKTCTTNLHLNYVCCKKICFYHTENRLYFCYKDQLLNVVLGENHNYKNYIYTYTYTYIYIYIYKDIQNCSFACCFVWAWSLVSRTEEGTKEHRLRVIKSRRMRWVGHEACMRDRRGTYRVLVGSPERKQPLGRPRRRWAANIKNGSSRSGKGRKGLDCCDSG